MLNSYALFKLRFRGECLLNVSGIVFFLLVHILCFSSFRLSLLSFGLLCLSLLFFGDCLLSGLKLSQVDVNSWIRYEVEEKILSV